MPKNLVAFLAAAVGLLLLGVATYIRLTTEYYDDDIIKGTKRKCYTIDRAAYACFGIAIASLAYTGL